MYRSSRFRRVGGGCSFLSYPVCFGETPQKRHQLYRRAVPWTLHSSDLVCLFRGGRSVRLEVEFSRHNKGRSLVIIHIIVVISQTPVYVERSKDESTARICAKKRRKQN
jgi:hypothetical protein